MSKKKKVIVGILFLAIMACTNILAILHQENIQDITVSFHVVADAKNDTKIQVYYKQKNYENEKFSTNHMLNLEVTSDKGMNDYEIALPGDASSVRINPMNVVSDEIEYKEVYLAYKDDVISVSSADIDDGVQMALYNDETQFAVVEMLYSLDSVS